MHVKKFYKSCINYMGISQIYTADNKRTVSDYKTDVLQLLDNTALQRSCKKYSAMAVDVPFVLFLVGVLITYCSTLGVYSLVSSINVDEGLGTWSLALAYGTSILFANVTPVIGCVFGCKKLLLMAEISWLLFILGNSYPSYYTVLPAGFFLGIGEATGWTAMPIITTYFAKRRASDDPQNMEKHIRYYTGYYFGVMQSSIVVGNAINFMVLYIDGSLADTSPVFNATKRNIDYSVCGGNDCQDGNITSKNIEQYVPAFSATRYVLIGIYSILLISSILLHSMFLPKDIQWHLTVPETNDTPPNTKDAQEMHLVAEESTTLNTENNFDRTPEEKSFTKNLTSKDDDKAVARETPQHKVALQTVFILTIKATLKIWFNPKHLLVVMLPIYNGMVLGYVVAELTRAYTSCILGVGKVGFCMMIFSSADCIFSVIAGKMAGKFGRNIPYLIAFLIDIGFYVFSVHWEFNAGNEWLIYIMFLLLGCSDGIWQTLIAAMYGEYFIEEQQLAYNLWNVMLNVGLLIQYSMSTATCVYTKQYTLIAVLCVAVTSYGISQCLYYPTEICKCSDKNAEKSESPTSP